MIHRNHDYPRCEKKYNYIRIFATLKYRIHSLMIFIPSSENVDKLIFSKQCSSKKKKARLKYYELLIYSHSWKKREFPRFWQRSQKRKVAEKSVQGKRKESEKGRKLNETRKKKEKWKKNCDKVKKKDKERGEIYLLQRSSTWLHLANTNRSPQILCFSFRTLSILPPEWQAIAWPRQKALSPLNPLSNKTPFAWGSMQLGYNPMIASMKTSVVMKHSEDNSNSFLS